MGSDSATQRVFYGEGEVGPQGKRGDPSPVVLSHVLSFSAFPLRATFTMGSAVLCTKNSCHLQCQHGGHS